MAEVKYSVLVEALDNFSKPARKMASVSTDLAKQLGEGQQKLKDLGKSQVAVQGLQKLEMRLASTGSEISAVRNQLALSGLELKKTAAPTKVMLRHHEKFEAALTKLHRTHGRLSSQASERRTELAKTGIDVKNLASEYNNLENQIKQTNSRLRGVSAHSAAQEAFQARKDAAYQRAAHMSLVGSGLSRVGHQAASTLTTPLELVRRIERARGELQSLGIKDTDAIVKVGENMTRQWAGLDTASIVSAAYDIKSGISSLTDQQVAEVTATAALTAKSTKANVSQMTSLFATGYGIYKSQYSDLSDSQFSNVFSAQISAAVNTFKTEGPKMQQAVENLGAGLAASGIPMAEQLSVLAALQNTNQAGSVGTQMAALERTIGTAQQRFDEMGVSIRLLNDTGNMKSIPDIMDEIHNAFDGEYTAAAVAQIKKAFGDEPLKLIQSLWKVKDLRERVSLVSEAGIKGIKYTREMARHMDDNADSRITVATQRWQLVQEKLGYALLPLAERLLPHLESGADTLGRFIDEFPDLSKVVIGGTAVVGGLAIVAGPVITAVGGLTIAMALMGSQARKTSRLLQTSAASGYGLEGPAKRRRRMFGKIAKFGGGVAAATSALAIGSTLLDDNKSNDDKIKSVGSEIGSLGGALAGVAAGAAIGSVVPVFGTIIGGLAGLGLSIGGSYFGGKLGNEFAEWFTDDPRNAIPEMPSIQQAAAARNNVANQNVVQNVTNHFQNVADPREAGRHVGESIRKASEDIFTPVYLVDTEPVF